MVDRSQAPGDLAQPATDLVAVVRGTNDVASAVAHRLFRAGVGVALYEDAEPTTSRRGMAFADAIFDGSAQIDGVVAVRWATIEDVRSRVQVRQTIAVFVGPLAALIAGVRPDVLVDARMRKRDTPEQQLGLAPLTIGLGPNFVAGDTTDLAVETAWGDDLGRVIESGPTLPLSGEPRPIAGHARDRYVYAPTGGAFRTTLQIGTAVWAGQAVATVDGVTLLAPLDGVLRGLTHDGVHVGRGAKVIEVDPRGENGMVVGLGERPGRIADGVLAAILQKFRPRSIDR